MKRLSRVLKNPFKVNFITLLSIVIVGMIGGPALTHPPKSIGIVERVEQDVTQGALRVNIADEVVECPLKHTDVKVNISGFIARATVTQTFHNPYDENIKAVYVFPLPHTAAIDAMEMKIGDRTIVGVMKRRAEARAIYEQAIRQGQTASLLEQERPNIFTQSVGNIKPNAEIHIEISYVDVLNYDLGTYEFHFPMVVGPRYIPGAPISEKPPVPKELEGKVGEIKEGVDEVTLNPDPSGTGGSPDTTRVPDASRITPPVLKPGYRTGHDIRLSVSLDAGVAIQDIESVNHAAALERIDTSKARVEISPRDAIPNKDFVMKYKVVGEKPELAVFAHASGPEQRYFMLMIQPKLDASLLKASPRELVFLIDVSGSMSGEPMAKVKAAMRQFLHLSKPDDTLQVITFAGQAHKLFQSPVPATQANIARALTFTSQLHGGGGTEMLAGIQAVLNAPVDPKRGRIVVMLTDGYIGNEEEIISEVGKRAGDAIHFWTIGIGASPNRLLIDGVAKQSGGMSEVLDLNTNPKLLTIRIMHRIHRAQLTDLQIDWKQLAVYETYPRRIPELWADGPVILFGRYAAGGKTEITLSGTADGTPVTYPLEVTLPDADPTHDVLAKVWARKKIEDLSAQMSHTDTPEVVEEITRIALDYRLISQYTSFVAVDAHEMADPNQQAKPPRRILVPVPLPEGVDFQGIFGGLEEEPQFFYDFFKKTGILDSPNLAPQFGRRNGLNEESGYAGYGSRYGFRDRYIDPSRLQSFVPQTPLTDASANLAPQALYQLPAKQIRASGPKRDFPFQDHSFRSAWVVQEALATQAVKRHEYAKAAVAEAQTLQQEGHLEAARLRYQHVLGLMTGIQSDNDTLATAVMAIQALNDAILEKRAQAYPGLNRKLNVVLRNQRLADAIRTLVNAGGFYFDLVPGSLDDVATLLNLAECRVPYLDVRHATMIQGLEWLLAPYHLTWRMKDAKTITIGTARRMPGPSVWGYDVHDIVIPWVDAAFDEETPLESIENALTRFLKTLKSAIAPKADSHPKSDATTLIDLGRLLIYGDPDVHEKVNQFLEVLREDTRDVASIIESRVSEEAYIDLKTLQKLTAAQSKTFAKTHELRISAKARQRLVIDLQTASWQLLAEALKDEIHLEALTTLQMAWASPQLEALVEEDPRHVARSAWCIPTAAQVIPTNTELIALSKRVFSEVKQIRRLKPRDASLEDYLGTLYAVLVLQNGNAHDSEVQNAIEGLIREPGNANLRTAHLIAEGFLSPSESNDKALQAALAADQIYGDDLVLLTCLIAKQRGGQLWRTFWEEFPDIANQSPLSGPMLVLINRLAASDAFVNK